MLRLVRRFVRSTSGAALVEGALVVPIAIALMAGGTEFARMYVNYDTAEKAVRSATRYLARVPRDQICAGWGLSNARNLAVYGKIAPAAGDAPLLSGMTTAMVTLASPTVCPPTGDPVIVRLEASIPHTGIMLGAIGITDAMTIRVRHEERFIGE